MIAALAAALAAATPAIPCTPVPGAERLWARPIHWVVVGEIHGTAETPAAFLDLACLAARSGRPVTVALEWSRDGQATVDAFVRSDGGPEALAALRGLPVFTGATPDGRGSRAFVALLDGLRRMMRAGQIRGIVLADMSGHGPPPRAIGRTRDQVIADAWITAGPPDGLVLALVGSVHAIRHYVPRPGGLPRPAATWLPADRTLSVDVAAAPGEAWNCQTSGCGPHPAGSDGPAGLTPSPDARWDYLLQLAAPFTASPPAVSADPVR